MECPICEALENGTTIKKGEHCSFIESPFRRGDKLIVTNAHVPVPSTDSFKECVGMSQVCEPKGLIGDIPESIGHWAVRLIFFKDQGKSMTKSEQ